MMKMRNIHVLTILLLLSIAVPSALAEILSSDSITIEFVQGRVPEGVTWSPSMLLTNNGLQTKALHSPNAFWNVWIQSQAIPVGLSWRAPTSARLQLSLKGDYPPSASASAYFRYSSDRVHWSSWYNMMKMENAGLMYQANISLPDGARERYETLMREWRKTDPDWSSDENAFCVWLTRHHPEYFGTEYPFIGYVQVRIEDSSTLIQLTELKIAQSWGVSGLHSEPKRKAPIPKEVKWSFDLSSYIKTDR
jgi:hypothetical protein